MKFKTRSRSSDAELEESGDLIRELSSNIKSSILKVSTLSDQSRMVVLMSAVSSHEEGREEIIDHVILLHIKQEDADWKLEKVILFGK